MATPRELILERYFALKECLDEYQAQYADDFEAWLFEELERAEQRLGKNICSECKTNIAIFRHKMSCGKQGTEGR